MDKPTIELYSLEYVWEHEIYEGQRKQTEVTKKLSTKVEMIFFQELKSLVRLILDRKT